MLSRLRLAGPLAGVFLTIFLVASAGALADPPPGPGHSGEHHKAVCPGPAAPGNTRCDAQVVTDSSGTPLVTGGPTAGYQPFHLQAAYNLGSASTSLGAGSTVAIVDAYHDPNAANDLTYYRQHVTDVNGNTLPDIQTSGCSVTTSTTPCFQQVNQNGGTTPPASDASWSQEIALDIDMASAICPKCNILLVEASSSYMSDLGTAENTAASLGATAISNSWGGNEFSSETSYDGAYFNHPGIPITVSSGDNGYGVEYPASSPNVTAVGGTHLVTSSTTRGWSETAWSGAGSGCSAVESRPSWQTGIAGVNCTRRLVADVSAVADPNTGVSVYDSYPYGGQSGWLVFGGTSVASPIVASVYALAANSPGLGYPYSHTSSLNDVTSGRNGRCNRDPKLCTAGTGWDGPTGWGTPNGTGGF